MKSRILFIPLILSVLVFSGCDTIKSVASWTKAAVTFKTSADTADTIIVDAEKTTAIAAETMDQFVKQERRYSSEVKQYAPKVHDFAEYLRTRVDDPAGPPGKTTPRGIAFIKAARIATKTFKANRTPAGEANLKTAIATVKDLLAKTKQSLVAIQGMKGP